MTAQQWPWPAGAATGIGSLPGTDIAEAQKMVLGELPELPHLAELPARGPGADLVGRGAALLVDLPVELYAARWRVAARPGRDLRRARDLHERDLDQLAEQAAGYRGPLKVQAAGPWTLAAQLDLPAGGRLLRDPGAVRELAASLAEGLRAYAAQVAARVPGASVLLQLDEPSLPAVLAGRVPTESGLGTLRPVPAGPAAELLRTVIAAAGVPVIVHCCAPDPPLDLIRAAGAGAVAVDLDAVDRPGATERLDVLGEALDAGLGLLAGAAATTPGVGPSRSGSPTPPPRPAAPGAGAPAGPAGGSPAGRAPDPRELADRVRRLWRRLGLTAERLPSQVVVTPACGLAGAAPGWARDALAACRAAGRELWEAPEP
ncbi:MAG TPA: methionine synthase [Pilimelia sp.]|nr:methionine synthase [Pilimelia sp.]